MSVLQKLPFDSDTSVLLITNTMMYLKLAVILPVYLLFHTMPTTQFCEKKLLDRVNLILIKAQKL